MRLLLDTHAFLWAISDEPRLGPHSRDLITTEARSDMPLSIAQAIPWAQACGFELLPLDLPHLLTLEQLPLHHRDPFDRLLVAQSIAESLLLVSADKAFQAYGCPLHDARR
jgi:PIN domain nuclease of toxin-antitoxin system